MYKLSDDDEIVQLFDDVDLQSSLRNEDEQLMETSEIILNEEDLRAIRERQIRDIEDARDRPRQLRTYAKTLSHLI
ncbi:hypothetical protein FQR65_LT18308 [Abscondita terminalis]|nr:hypothetical protein FQR65_LT18308 [Abscondita terminalis]